MMIGDAEHLLRFLAICISSFKKCLFIYFAHLMQLFFSWWFLVDTGYESFAGYVVCKYFFPFCGLSAYSAEYFFCYAELFSLISHIYLFLVLLPLLLGS